MYILSATVNTDSRQLSQNGVFESFLARFRHPLRSIQLLRRSSGSRRVNTKATGLVFDFHAFSVDRTDEQTVSG